MSARPYHKRYHSDALAGCMALTLEERGAYQTLQDLMYDRQGPILDAERLLAGYMGVSIRKWRSLRETLLAKGKIFLTEDGRVSSESFDPVLYGRDGDRQPLPKWLRAFILERDGYRCTYCGQAEGPFEVDHIVPVSRGGGDDPENLTCACAPCNRSKSSTPVEEWLACR
ncbi:HNH endonuclease [Novosphingobium sp. BL-8H]|uniref:HNH endonuclease n=1 Tax=Novosphingobium sp. BL-8H TaxID=3127640 RepID=UPI00375808CA